MEVSHADVFLVCQDFLVWLPGFGVRDGGSSVFKDGFGRWLELVDTSSRVSDPPIRR